MSRLLKKCLFLSIGLHVLLAAVLIFCTAFFVSKPEKILPTLSMIAPDVLDNLLKPQRVSKPKPISQLPARRIVTPPPMRPQIMRKPPPRPMKITKTIPKPKPPRRKPTKNKAAPKPRKKVIRIAKNTQTFSSAPSRTTKNKPKKVIRIAKNTQTFSSAPSRIPKNKPKIDAPLVDNGVFEKIKGFRSQPSAAINVKVSGANVAAFAEYSSIVMNVYRVAWKLYIPRELERLRTAKMSVVIGRDGRVLSARIIHKTGEVALDRSVQRALDHVKKIGKPFPPGSKDSQRTFTLDFKPNIRGGN